MRLTCPHCAHQWQTEPAPQVTCPECGKQLRVRPHQPDPEAPTEAAVPPSSLSAAPDTPTLESASGQSRDAVGMLFNRGPTEIPAKTGESSSMQRRHADAEQMEALVDESLGGYRIQGLLGMGGMGGVFKARQLSLDRDVALKVLPHRLADKPDMLARFTREALSAAQLTHHNIVQVYDVGSDRGEHYISMEFVPGRTMTDLIRSDGRLTVDDAAGYGLQAARGLAYAHDRGIIHRDIKPDNLMLNEQGIVKIADMGLAKIIGAPEQGDGKTDYVRQELKQARADLTIANRGMGTPPTCLPNRPATPIRSTPEPTSTPWDAPSTTCAPDARPTPAPPPTKSSPNTSTNPSRRLTSMCRTWRPRSRRLSSEWSRRIPTTATPTCTPSWPTSRTTSASTPNKGPIAPASITWPLSTRRARPSTGRPWWRRDAWQRRDSSACAPCWFSCRSLSADSSCPASPSASAR